MKNFHTKCIDRISINQLTKINFEKTYLLKQKPLIITHIFDQIPSLSFWTPEFLVEKLQNKLVKVNTSKDGNFALDPKKGKHFSSPLTIGFRDYINLIKNKETIEKLYMQQISICRELPELKNELIFPTYIINTEDIKEINLWVGPGGNTSPLHYDRANNFFIQLYGTKKFWLADPMQFNNIYPNSCFSKAAYMSKVNLYTPDNIKYPKFSKVNFIDFTIEAGEMLFLPAYWWHQVYSVDTTVSMNIWCSSVWYKNFVPGAFHSLLSIYYHLFKKYITRIIKNQ